VQSNGDREFLSSLLTVRELFINGGHGGQVPVFSHRYMPASACAAGNPVFSVMQTDIVSYGNTLTDYFIREFAIRVPSSCTSAPFQNTAARRPPQAQGMPYYCGTSTRRRRAGQAAAGSETPSAGAKPYPAGAWRRRSLARAFH
jgi:hypothetical protein